MIFVTHYRKPVINDEMSAAMKEFSNHMAEQFRGKVLSAETDRDHIRLLVSTATEYQHIRLCKKHQDSVIQRDAPSDFRNRSNSIFMGTIPHSGAAATLSQLPEVFLLKQ